jgi:hypothetical protein
MTGKKKKKQGKKKTALQKRPWKRIRHIVGWNWKKISSH